MRRTNWTTVLLLALLGIAVLWLGGNALLWGGRYSPGAMWCATDGWRMHGMMDGQQPGNMMSGWLFWPMRWFWGMGLLLPLWGLAFLLLGAAWILRRMLNPSTEQGGQTHFSPTARTCPGCGHTVQPDWKLCPLCGQSLTTEHVELVATQTESSRG